MARTMTKHVKYLFGAFGIALVATLAYCLWCYVEVIKPHRFLAEVELKMANDPNTIIPYEKTRVACHKILRDKNGNHHDAFLMLSLVGNHESIPYLLKALKPEGPPSKDGGISCSTFHCIGALEKTTGTNLWLSYGPWEKWWREVGSKLPPDVIEANASNQWAEIISKQHVGISHLDNHEK